MGIISINSNSKQHEDQPVVHSIQRILFSVHLELSLRQTSFLFVSQYSGLTFLPSLKSFKDPGFLYSSSLPNVGTRPLFLSFHGH